MKNGEMMATAEIEVIEEGADVKPAMALATRPSSGQLVNRELAAGLLRPVAAPDEIVRAQDETRELVAKALKDGRDYGKIPGTDKATLLKPGAERINAAYGIAAEYLISEKEIDHDRSVSWSKRKKKWRNQFQGDREFTWEEERGVSYGLYRYVIECRLIHRASGVMVGQGLGSCSTMEGKYIDRPREMENTVIKMAGKRAYIAATLNTHGLSDQFTQDMEDFVHEDKEQGNGSSSGHTSGSGTNGSAHSNGTAGTKTAITEKAAECPNCGGPMWDNRPKKEKGEYAANAPDFKCKKKDCDGKIWPEKEGATAAEVAAEMDRLAGGIKSMINELSGLNAERSDKAQVAFDELLTAENTTPEKLQRLGSQIVAALKEEQAAAVPVAADGEPIDDDPDAGLPF